jgi:hypothetical protein
VENGRSPLHASRRKDPRKAEGNKIIEDFDLCLLK